MSDERRKWTQPAAYQRNIFDSMMLARDEALREHKEPVAWSVNRAAIYALLSDERIANQYREKPLETYPFCGIPFKVNEHDRSEEWRFSLSTKMPRPPLPA